MEGVLEPLLDQSWKLMATEAAADKRRELGLDLTNLDHLVAGLQLELGRIEAEEGDKKNKAKGSVGASGLVLHLNEAVDHDSIRRAINVDRLIEETEEAFNDETVKEALQGKTASEFVEGMLSCIFKGGGTSTDAGDLAESQRGR